MYELISVIATNEFADFVSQFLLEYYTQRDKNFTNY